MKILTDVHTHTNASTHAYSTIKENVDAALAKGLQILATTNHAPPLPDAAHLWHFPGLRYLPREIDGLLLLSGAECNISSVYGDLDFTNDVIDEFNLDIIIASFHAPVYKPTTAAERTSAMVAALHNTHVDILGHPGRGGKPFDVAAVVDAAKANGKLIEVNGHTLENLDKDGKSKLLCVEIVKACKDKGVQIVVNSDAHSCYHIGSVDKAVAMLEQIDFPEELIANRTRESFLQYLNNRARPFNLL